jgi:hypothetical protein
LSLRYDTESNASYASGCDHLGPFQFNWLNAQMIKQSDAVAEQNGRKVNQYLIGKTDS